MCYGTSRVESSFSLRFPLGMQAGVSTLLAIGSPFLPHSPRWLRHVGRGAEADIAWVRLGVSAADAEKTEETANRVEVPRTLGGKHNEYEIDSCRHYLDVEWQPP